MLIAMNVISTQIGGDNSQHILTNILIMVHKELIHMVQVGGGVTAAKVDGIQS